MAQASTICQFLVRWIYYCHSSESTGKQTGKTNLCVMSITYSSISAYFQFLNNKMVVLKVLREFAADTKIHGFKFLFSPKSSSGTKIIWAISLVVALSYASWEMRKSAISKYHYIS
jgi:hypothetical protein